MRDTERQRHRQREKQAPCRKHDVGLDPGTPGAHPEPKAGAPPLSPAGVPKPHLLSMSSVFSSNYGIDPIRTLHRCVSSEKKKQFFYFGAKSKTSGIPPCT